MIDWLLFWHLYAPTPFYCSKKQSGTQ